MRSHSSESNTEIDFTMTHLFMRPRENTPPPPPPACHIFRNWVTMCIVGAPEETSHNDDKEEESHNGSLKRRGSSSSSSVVVVVDPFHQMTGTLSFSVCSRHYISSSSASWPFLKYKRHASTIDNHLVIRDSFVFELIFCVVSR